MSEMQGSHFHSDAVRSRPFVKEISNGYGQRSIDTVALGSKDRVISPQDMSQVQFDNQSPNNQTTKEKENLIKNLNQLSSLQQYEHIQAKNRTSGRSGIDTMPYQ